MSDPPQQRTAGTARNGLYRLSELGRDFLAGDVEADVIEDAGEK